MNVLKVFVRLEIPIYNCTSLVLQVNPHVHSDCNILRRVLESAKNCRVAPLIWQKRKFCELKHLIQIMKIMTTMIGK